MYVTLNSALDCDYYTRYPYDGLVVLSVDGDNLVAEADVTGNVKLIEQQIPIERTHFRQTLDISAISHVIERPFPDTDQDGIYNERDTELEYANDFTHRFNDTVRNKLGEAGLKMENCEYNYAVIIKNPAGRGN